MKFLRGCIALLFLALPLPLAAFVPKQEGPRDALRLDPPRITVRGERIDPTAATPAAAAAAAFLERYGGQWIFSVDPRTARFDLVQGSGIPLIPGRGNALGPEVAYRFALGEEIVTNSGQRARLIRPLDFLVISDHAENLGLSPMIERRVCPRQTPGSTMVSCLSGPRCARLLMARSTRRGSSVCPPMLPNMPHTVYCRKSRRIGSLSLRAVTTTRPRATAVKIIE